MISIERRKMIMQAQKDGMTMEEILRAYHVGRSTVYNLNKLAEETGDIRPRPHRYGRKPALDEKQLSELRQLLDEQCDIALHEIIEEMELKISISALSRIIRNKLNYKFKKRRYMPVNETDRM